MWYFFPCQLGGNHVFTQTSKRDTSRFVLVTSGSSIVNSEKLQPPENTVCQSKFSVYFSFSSFNFLLIYFN